MSRLRVVGVVGAAVVVAVTTASCAAQRSYYLYDAKATAACLEKAAPKYRGIRPSPLHPKRPAPPYPLLDILVSRPIAYGPPRAAPGTWYLGVGFLDGYVEHTSTVDMYFSSTELWARRFYTYERRLYPAPSGSAITIQRRRNVTIVWTGYPTNEYMNILFGCLETG